MTKARRKKKPRRSGLHPLNDAYRARARRRWAAHGANIPAGWIPPADPTDRRDAERLSREIDRGRAEAAYFNATEPVAQAWEETDDGDVELVSTYLLSGGTPVDEQGLGRYCADPFCGALLPRGGGPCRVCGR